MVMLHVPVTGTGTEHIVQVINVVISFPIDLDDRSSSDGTPEYDLTPSPMCVCVCQWGGYK
jgi:hypothetical protein